MERPVTLPPDADDAIAQLTLEIINRVAGSNSRLAELIRATALPHRFDVAVIEALQVDNEPKINSAKLFARLKTFSFITAVDDQTLAYHEKAREAILLFWREPAQMARYVYFSGLLQIYFEAKGDEFEALYHGFVVDVDVAFKKFRDKGKVMFPDPNNATVAEILIRLAQEQSWTLQPQRVNSVILAKAQINRQLSNWQQAIDDYEKILKDTDNMNLDMQSSAMLGLGQCLYGVGEWDKSRIILEQCLTISQELNHTIRIIVTLLALSATFADLDKVFESIAYSQQALQLAIDHNLKFQEGLAWATLGASYSYLSEWDKAIECYEKFIPIIGAKFNDNYFLGRTITGLSYCYIQKGNLEVAYSYLVDNLTRQTNINDRFGISLTLGNMGDYFYAKKEFDKSIEYYQQSLTIAHELGTKKQIAYNLKAIAQSYQAKNMSNQSEMYFNEAEKIYQLLGKVTKKNEVTDDFIS